MLTVKDKLLVARALNRLVWLPRTILGMGMRTRCTRRGITWDLDLNEGIDLSIYLLGAYELRAHKVYAPLIKPGNVVFDIGANIGAHTLHFASLVGNTGKVHAFEPTDYAATKLRANLSLNPVLATRVRFEQRFLVAGTEDKLPSKVFSRWPLANGHKDLDPGHLGKPELLSGATQITADEVCDQMKLMALDFVKLDVDGYELSVLRGFRKSLLRFRPVILVELAPFVYGDRESRDFDHLVDHISSLGYRITDPRTGRSFSGTPSGIRRQIVPGGSVNALLFPSSPR